MGLFSFLKSKNEKPKESSKNILSAQLKNDLRKELIIDSKKYFGSEYIRVFGLKNDIIIKYGFEGIKLVYEFDNSIHYYQLGELPEECPWFELNNYSIVEFITNNFEKIATKSTIFIDVLKEKCKYIYTEKKEDEWLLHYCLIKESDIETLTEEYVIFTGRTPVYYPKPNESLSRYNWNIPGDLNIFYTIHDGFGEREDVACFIVPSEDLLIMSDTAVVKEECLEKNSKPKEYSFDNLLQFYYDDNGNSLCFSKGDHSLIVDWDYETLKLTNEIHFFDFLDFLFVNTHEEYYDGD